MIKYHIEPHTKVPIEYTDNDRFTIYIKCQARKKKVVRTYLPEDIGLAIDEFYKLELSKYYRKHLVKEHKDQVGLGEGEILLNMKGFLPPHRSLSIKGRKENYKGYEKKASLNLTNCPKSLALKISNMPLSDYPIIDEQWTRTKVNYALLSYFYSLSLEEQNNILRKGYRLYIVEKLKSGGKVIEGEKYKDIAMASNKFDDVL